MGIFLGNSFYNCYGSCTGISTDRQIMPICVLFITYYSILEVWARYPVPRDRQLPHRIGRTAWHCDDGMSWSDARRSARGAADLIKSRGPSEYCTRGGAEGQKSKLPPGTQRQARIVQGHPLDGLIDILTQCSDMQ